MKKIFLFTILSILLILVLSFVFKFNLLNISNNKLGGVACTMEAKMCPDGVTYVGRSGPKCEFQACPEISNIKTLSSNGDVILSKGEVVKIDNFTINLNSIVQDSRCPIDVQCIQAGSVKVSLTLSDVKNTETKELSSDGSVLPYGEYKIFITDVSPAPKSTVKVSEQDYKVTFHVGKF